MEGIIQDIHDQRSECLMDERQRRDELVDAFWSCSSFTSSSLPSPYSLPVFRIYTFFLSRKTVPAFRSFLEVHA
ncbi:hypothetical protein NDA11_007264 [Ustilago hordei]|nr:hypothetical protein NDA10_005193 [Ustilago hordei]KAJ1578905.1 hypothetical protein NDA15_002012 [Ustilago hordei]KAJ1580565.1 hypothetical protein NDA12_001889 [Ustilago hordei]KAJ1581637.1 hypothetical protein NDA11_007264 [Ustilago hordei]KAJ1597218.1 hypothetical protein NDA14_001143 [Ustilago hordei]